MKFDLVRPCSNCPFRSDIPAYLNKKRAKEITDALILQQATFSCHKTNKFDDEGNAIETRDTQHCAGAMIFLEKLGRPNQLMRIAERFGGYDHTKLDMQAPIFRTPAEMIKAQPRSSMRTRR